MLTFHTFTYTGPGKPGRSKRARSKREREEKREQEREKARKRHTQQQNSSTVQPWDPCDPCDPCVPCYPPPHQAREHQHKTTSPLPVALSSTMPVLGFRAWSDTEGQWFALWEVSPEEEWSWIGWACVPDVQPANEPAPSPGHPDAKRRRLE